MQRGLPRETKSEAWTINEQEGTTWVHQLEAPSLENEQMLAMLEEEPSPKTLDY